MAKTQVKADLYQGVNTDLSHLYWGKGMLEQLLSLLLRWPLGVKCWWSST